MKMIIDPYIKAWSLKNPRISFWLRTGIQLPTSISWMHLKKLRWVGRSVFCFKLRCLVCMNYDTFLWVFGGESLESLRRFFLDRKNHPCFLTGSFTSLSLGSGPMIPLGRRSSMLMEIRNPKQPPTTGWDLVKPLVKNLGISTNKKNRSLVPGLVEPHPSRIKFVGPTMVQVFWISGIRGPHGEGAEKSEKPEKIPSDGSNVVLLRHGSLKKVIAAKCRAWKKQLSSLEKKEAAFYYRLFEMLNNQMLPNVRSTISVVNL